MTCHSFRARVNFYARNDSRIGDDFDKRSTVFLRLADCLVVEDHPADALTEIRRSHDHLSIRPAGLNGLGNPQHGKPFVAGWNTFIHRKQTLVICDQLPRGVYNFL